MYYKIATKYLLLQLNTLLTAMMDTVVLHTKMTAEMATITAEKAAKVKMNLTKTATPSTNTNRDGFTATTENGLTRSLRWTS